MGFLFGPKPEMITAEQALSGRDESINPTPQPHAVLNVPLDMQGESVLIGIGCFWGAEKMFWQLPGVLATSVGYAGGYSPNPTYREVCTGLTGHAEVVRVVFDPELTSLRELVIAALEAHDPTQGYRQGNDVGTQYRSIISSDNPQLVQELVDSYGATLEQHGYPAITTEVVGPVTYYLAEEEHQQYLHKNPDGYCPVHSTGVKCG
ncbi:peptide-methionine (S)-S-oxide reductase MsrA [Corynebacterium epidermidicanis]|nr:peptide-methionine (S)-S-oxide reductase MsrA [Corynebacterium epidermidicanis]